MPANGSATVHDWTLSKLFITSILWRKVWCPTMNKKMGNNLIIFSPKVAKRSEEARRENPEVTPHFVCMSGGEGWRFCLFKTSQIGTNILTEILVVAATATAIVATATNNINGRIIISSSSSNNNSNDSRSSNNNFSNNSSNGYRPATTAAISVLTFAAAYSRLHY